MKAGLRLLLRLAAVVLVVAAALLVVWPPKATVAGADLVTKVNVSVQCASVWDQWSHHAQPADLTLNGHPVVDLAAAQKSCASASHTIKQYSAGLIAAAVVALGISLLLRRHRFR